MLRPEPQQLVNRVVEIDGEDDYRYWYTHGHSKHSPGL